MTRSLSNNLTLAELIEEEYVTGSEEETFRLAERFAELLNPGDVVCLEGDLGAGKTHFVKGMARGLEIDPNEVHSPTFTLIHEYSGSLPLYHFDCYRLERVEEALEIGAEEYFYGGGVSVIEWPERIADIIPGDAIWIHIESTGARERRFLFSKEGQ